jgi:hypothetical protein
MRMSQLWPAHDKRREFLILLLAHPQTDQSKCTRLKSHCSKAYQLRRSARQCANGERALTLPLLPRCQKTNGVTPQYLGALVGFAACGSDVITEQHLALRIL